MISLIKIEFYFYFSGFIQTPLFDTLNGYITPIYGHRNATLFLPSQHSVMISFIYQKVAGCLTLSIFDDNHVDILSGGDKLPINRTKMLCCDDIPILPDIFEASRLMISHKEERFEKTRSF